MKDHFDFAVIGGGIAGASIAAHLAEHAGVVLLEMEPQPGYHSTGRSVSLFCETYGAPVVRALTRASRQFYFEPPSGFCSAPLVAPRPMLMIATTRQADALAALFASADPGDRIDRLSPGEAVEAFPLLSPQGLIGAALLRDTADIDVSELHQGYLRLFKSRSGIVRTDTPVVRLDRHADVWTLGTPRDELRAATVVNAAGAWAGEVGRLAGASDIGLRPLKRSVGLIEQPPGWNMDDWPLLVDAEEQFYAKPSPGKLFLSPADETLSPPCDAQADDFDLAEAVDRFERATTMEVKRLVGRWAGLRSFVADRAPVVGYDATAPGFFWVAALGGYGIQITPALSRLAASWALGRVSQDDDAAAALRVVGDAIETQLSPGRLKSPHAQVPAQCL